MTSSALVNQSRRSAFHTGKSRASGKRLRFAHPLEHAVEFRPLGEPFRVELGHHRERLVEEADSALGIELDGAGGHAVGELALRLHVPRKLHPRILEFLDVDREAGNRAGRQRDIDDPHHPPLAADRRRLHCVMELARLQRGFGGHASRCPGRRRRSARSTAK